MITPTFWIDLAAYSFATLIAFSLLLLALGTGIRRTLNLTFALLMAAVALWASCSVVLRVALWFETGTQLFWMELSTLGFTLMAPLLLIFSGVYIESDRQWPFLVAVISLILAAAFAFPLFNHQVITNVELANSGVVTWDRTWLGPLTSLPLLFSPILALFLLWREQRKLEDLYLPAAFTIMVVSSLIFSLVEVPFPTLSLSMIVVTGLLGYGVLNRQLFNPLRELTQHLEEQVAERTEALRDTTNELQIALRRAKRRAAYLQAAAEAARSVSGIREVEELLRETVRLISSRFNFYHAGIFLLNQDQDYAVLHAASSGEGQQMVAQGYRIRVGGSTLMGQAAAQKAPQTALEREEGDLSAALSRTRVQIALPLQVHERVIGVLDVQSTKETLADEDMAVLQILADQLAVGIENARLFAQTQSNLEELSRLYRAMTVEAWGEFAEARPGLQRYQTGESEVSESAWRSAFDKARREARPVSTCCAEGSEDGQHLLAVPVKLRGVPVGILGFHRPIQAGEWQPEEISLAEGVAERVALALENVRLLEEARRRAARERLISEITARTRESLDMETILSRAVQEIGEALGLAALDARLSTQEEVVHE